MGALRQGLWFHTGIIDFTQGNRLGLAMRVSCQTRVTMAIPRSYFFFLNHVIFLHVHLLWNAIGRLWQSWKALNSLARVNQLIANLQTLNWELNKCSSFGHYVASDILVQVSNPLRCPSGKAHSPSLSHAAHTGFHAERDLCPCNFTSDTSYRGLMVCLLEQQTKTCYNVHDFRFVALTDYLWSEAIEWP